MSSAARAVAGLLALLLAGCADPPPPNLILISVDTVRRDALRAYDPGARTLPALDAFAAESVRFAHAIAPAPWTLPSHGSLLTGLYPDRHGATDERTALDPRAPRLAGLLRANGYETVAFTGGGFLDASFGFAEGFDRYDGRAGEGASPVSLPRDGWPGDPPGRALFDRATAFLASRLPGGRPFFLLLHTWAVHHYYNATSWATARLPEFADRGGAGYLACLLARQACPPDVFERLEALYQTELGRFDRGLGALLRTLEAGGLAGETVVVLVSDHGEAFDVARRRLHHGGRLHADQLGVPFLLRAPGVAPRVVTQPVSLVDVAPTLLALAGIRRPPELDGRSLVPLLRGDGAEPARPVLAMEHYFTWDAGGRRDSPSIRPRPVAVAVVGDGQWTIEGPDGVERYALDGDPEQAHDLLAGGGDGARAAARARLRESLRGRPAARPDTPLVIDDPQLRERLRALGYAE